MKCAYFVKFHPSIRSPNCLSFQGSLRGCWNLCQRLRLKAGKPWTDGQFITGLFYKTVWAFYKQSISCLHCFSKHWLGYLNLDVDYSNEVYNSRRKEVVILFISTWKYVIQNCHLCSFKDRTFWVLWTRIVHGSADWLMVHHNPKPFTNVFPELWWERLPTHKISNI